ncbi:MAG: response regulator transcription factor [Saprospiraceae bacterium]|nr:response regulator transcription factor [Saprospiraceae bacterium]
MFSALIIDDEKRALNGLKLLLETHIPEIRPIYTALGSSEGYSEIQKLHPDLVFLDVEMPGMTGFEMLEALRDTRINVIFTTAYDHYAIKAIRFSAIDYLLKPIDVQELKAAVNRYLHRPLPQEHLNPLIDNLVSNLKTRQFKKPRLAITTTGGLTFLDIDEIVHCEADNNYTIFHLSGGKRFISSKTLKEYDDLLSEYDFLRVHQSYLVNPVYIKEYSQKGNLELKEGRTVNVSRRKHHWLLDKLKSLYR